MAHGVIVFGATPLPCGIDDLKDSVFRRLEGLGDITGAGCGKDRWNLDIEFDSSASFIGVMHAVLESLHEHHIDPFSVTVSVRGRRHPLVDLI